jgi:hypothetical protein
MTAELPRRTGPVLRGPLAVALVALAGVAVGVAIGAMVTVAFRRANEPQAGANGSPAPAPQKAEQAAPSPAARPAKPRQKKEAPRPAAVPTPRPARLTIELAHSLEKGTMRVWVDDDLSAETRLDGEATKKMLVLKGRKGSIAQTFAVSPGEHEIRVEVAWGDSVKTKQLIGDFKPGATRKIAAKLGGFLKKNLSLEWQ